MRKPSSDTSSRRAFLKTAALGTMALALPTGPQRRLAASTPEHVDFLDAVARGDLDTVRQLLAADASLLHLTDAQGRSAYALAWLNGHEAVGTYLREQGYESDVHEAALALDWERFTLLSEQQPGRVNADHPIGGTTMYAAALGGAGMDIWRVYAAAGRPNLNPRQADGATPLQAALQHRDRSVAILTAASILSNNGDPNPPLNAEPPPLHLAAERGMFDTVEMLLHFGADAEARDAQGKRATEYAYRAGHGYVVDLLNRADEIPRVHKAGRAALDAEGNRYTPPDLSRISIYEREQVVGVSHRSLEAVKTALTTTPDLAHAIATTGERAVEAGAHTGNHDIVEFLLERGAPYALPTAVMRNDLARVKAMLDADPLRIYERGAHGFALLWYPIIGRTGLDMMQLLLDCGADVEQQHFLGTTALHWACRGDSVEMVTLLLEHGADPNRVGRKFGGRPMTPLQTALAADHADIAQVLRDRGAK